MTRQNRSNRPDAPLSPFRIHLKEAKPHMVRCGVLLNVDSRQTPYPALVTCPRCLDRFTLDELQATDPNNEPEGV